MKIVIDNPCHENWDAMSPNDKGAFCLSCQKTVIDFSVKTVEEIKNFFVELPGTESVCGRFKEEQLEEISFGHFFTQFKRWKYFQKAAVIAFFIFGSSLFGGAQTAPKDHPMMMKGEVAFIIPPDSIAAKHKKDSINALTLDPNPEIMTMGGPRYIPDQHPKEEPKPKKVKLMGKPGITRDPH
jgi:hypothetical protein